MPSRFLRDLSTSGLQLLLNQALAFGLFLLLSRQLGKESFGDLSWCLALLLIIFTLAGAGLEPLVIRKIAGGEPEAPLLAAYLRHLAITGVFALAVLSIFALGFLSSGLAIMLLVLAGGKWALSLVQPFKAWAAGRQRFRLLLLLSIPAATLKLVFVSILVFFQTLQIPTLLLCLALADLAEAGIGFFLLRKEWPRSRLRSAEKIRIPGRGPQIGMIVFGTLLSRFDQVLLGWLRPSSDLADYAFCTRVLELSLLPLLAIGPVLLPRMSRSGGAGLRHLLFAELALAVGTLLVLNLAWTPVVDSWTAGRYGARNEGLIFLLSLGLPLLYLNNFLWTRLFTEGQLKPILRTVGLTFLVNLALNCLLIPGFGARGAAIAFVTAQLVQCLAYLFRVGPRHFFTPQIAHDHPVHL